MKICIDGIGISLLSGTGLYSYTYEILNNLFDMYPQPLYEIICDKETNIDKWNRNDRVALLNLTLNRKEDSNGQLLKHINEERIGLFHSLNNGFSIPQGRKKEDRCKYVTTVHDMISISNSRLVDDLYRNKFTKVVPMALENSHKIVAVSEFIKSEIINYYGTQEDKIEVVYPGCGERYKPMDNDLCRDLLRKEYNIEGNIILYAGSIHKRKNLTRLLYIFKEVLRFNKDIKLVIVGKNSGKRFEYYNELIELGKSLDLGDKVLYAGEVKYEKMPYFYNAAKCVVNLSDYEGFPMTSIEALCCGTPVICSNAEGFKETIKNEGILVYKNNEKQVSEVLQEVINDNRYKEVAIMNSKSVRERYSWQKSVIKHVSIYETLAFS